MSETAYKDMNKDELETELLALTREQFNLRIQKATSEFKKPHLFKKIRRNIARVKTYLAQQAGK